MLNYLKPVQTAATPTAELDAHPLRGGLRQKGGFLLDRISVDNRELMGYLRLVRRRLHELSTGGALIEPRDLDLLISMIDKVEDEHATPFS